jgi:hypothetical protein
VEEGVSEFELSRDEIRRMARSHTREGQLKFLRLNGIRHYVDAHGWPVVLRSAVEGEQAGKPAQAAWAPRKAANG